MNNINFKGFFSNVLIDTNNIVFSDVTNQKCWNILINLVRPRSRAGCWVNSQVLDRVFRMIIITEREDLFSLFIQNCCLLSFFTQFPGDIENYSNSVLFHLLLTEHSQTIQFRGYLSL